MMVLFCNGWPVSSSRFIFLCLVGVGFNPPQQDRAYFIIIQKFTLHRDPIL
jgi:hypothetical protein